VDFHRSCFGGLRGFLCRGSGEEPMGNLSSPDLLTCVERARVAPAGGALRGPSLSSKTIPGGPAGPIRPHWGASSPEAIPVASLPSRPPPGCSPPAAGKSLVSLDHCLNWPYNCGRI
jgi:hypothetical protein